jgi:adenylate cyclase
VADVREKRQLAAIVFTDVAGYSRMMGRDETGTARRLGALKLELIDPKTWEHSGRVIKSTGDGWYLDFASAVDAVRWAVEVQRLNVERNVGLPQDIQMVLRVGMNVGDVILVDDDVLGDAVNIAARLEPLCEPGGICMSATIYDLVRGKLNYPFQEGDLRTLKHIVEPVRTFVLSASSVATTPLPGPLSVPRLSLAVLPLVNSGGDPNEEYFCDGVTRDLSTTLAKVRWFFVISPSSTFPYKGLGIDEKQIAAELRVPYLLAGDIRKTENRIYINVHLTDARMGRHIWAERYEREVGDLFALQDEIAAAVVATIEPPLKDIEGIRSGRRRPKSIPAWDCVMRASVHINNRRPEDLLEAKTLLQKAIAYDGEYSLAYGLMAYVDLLSVHYDLLQRGVGISAALEAAEKAVALNQQEPWAFLARGFVWLHMKEPAEGVEEFERALALNPNFAFAHTSCGAALCYLGEVDKAMARIDSAERLSPRDLLDRHERGTNNTVRATACFVASEYARGITFGRKALEQNPALLTARRTLVVNYALDEKLDLAKMELDLLKKEMRGISLASIEDWLPYIRPDDRERFLRGYRLAGLT